MIMHQKVAASSERILSAGTETEIIKTILKFIIYTGRSISAVYRYNVYDICYCITVLHILHY